MHGVIAGSDSGTTKRTVRTGSEITITDQTDSDDENWFADLCKLLIPNDAGLQLSLSTGFEERTCYRYAAGDRKPPAYFLRELLRSEQGWQWLSGIMDGADAEWFEDIKRAKRKADAYDAA